jgi:hypothetical protein
VVTAVHPSDMAYLRECMAGEGLPSNQPCRPP